MKTLDSLQLKLHEALKRHPKLKIHPGYPWNDPQIFEGVVAVVKDYANHSGDVITDADPLVSWLDEYQFFVATRTSQ